jgi:peroxiredoxin
VRKFVTFVLAFSFALSGLLLPSASSLLAAGIPAEGAVFPDLTLPLPQKADEREYLRIEKGPFKISQIRADVLIVEVFSMYCPYCQKEAPNVNALYRTISDRPGLKGNVKLIGIGAGNSSFEVNAFRNLYAIPFPLFHDADYSIHRTLGEVRTPHFFVIKRGRDGSNRIVYSQVGSFGAPEAFLDLILDKSGLSGQK